MSGRYIRNVAQGERWDPTMTGVPDVTAFHIGEYIYAHNRYAFITKIDEAVFGDENTRFLHLNECDPPNSGLAVVHDFHENDMRNAFYNGMLPDGCSPSDAMTFEQFKQQPSSGR